MRYSGIGGQAVMEGVMMKNKDTYAVAVRKADGEIEVKTDKYEGIVKSEVWNKIPLVRGVVNFIDSLVLGISTLMYSATFFEEEEEEKPKKKGKSGQTGEAADADASAGGGADSGEKSDKLFVAGTLTLSLVLAVAIFLLLPYGLSVVFQKFISNATVIAVIEGVLRLAIFIIYVVLISQMEDIKRTFMYHGAEHKCINCIEHGLDLNVENVRKSSKEHKRCGTSFLMFVVVISIIAFLFIRVDSHVLKIVIRLLLIPVIAGISYELLRAAGRSDGKVINLISRPGLWLQHLTTSEPDDSMIEVGIASVEAVFDWRSYVAGIRESEGEEPLQKS